MTWQCALITTAVLIVALTSAGIIYCDMKSNEEDE